MLRPIRGQKVEAAYSPDARHQFIVRAQRAVHCLTLGLARSTDHDGFIAFSLSVQNRRKARAGLALENHLEAMFVALGIRHSRGAITEHKSKPDFLFPGIEAYRDPSCPAARLTMLGSKSTSKDRWRQVLAEADRIDEKHLTTLEPGISRNQTDEMQAKRLRLVLPRELHRTYKPEQQSWLLSLADFVALVRARENAAGPA